MKSVLFVDDEPRVLDALQRTLRPQRKLWDMTFVASGDEALTQFENKRFDVIVTDMRMPGMDGAALLQQVRERYPGAIRIVLSGDFEMTAALRAVPVAHRFLAKPCDPEKLKEAIDRACAIALILPDASIRRIAGAVGRLPAMPKTTAALLAAIERPEVSLDEVSHIIEQDVAITAKILQLVNSAFFSQVREVTSIPMAISFIGLDALRQIAVSASVFRTFHPTLPVSGFSFTGFERHSRLAARIAGLLPAPPAVKAAGLVSAILHDAGKLVLASRMPRDFERANRIALERKAPLSEVEDELIGASHAEIGAYLLGLWGLPEKVVEAVWRHHTPVANGDGNGELDETAVAHLADALANEVSGPGPYCPPTGRVRTDYLEAIGVLGKLEEWTALAREAALELREGL